MDACGGPVGPWLSTACLPVKGTALRSVSLRDGLRPPLTASLLGRAETPQGGGGQRPATPEGPGRPTPVAEETAVSSTNPRIRRVTAEPTIDMPGTVACPHCGGRVELSRTEPGRPPVALVVVMEPGPRTAAETAAVRAMLAGTLRRILEVIAGRRPVGQLGDGVDPRVLRYVRACRTGAGQAWVLRSVRVYFPVEDSVELAAVVASTGRVRAVAARFDRHGDRWRCVVFRLL